jgi:preprotein translocase subunit SecD
MNKNLNKKIALIIAVLLVFIFGIFRVPSGISGKALLDAIGQNIHLGLDLRGGAHLILKVVVSEAVSAETDNQVADIQTQLKTASLKFSQVMKPDPANKPTVIVVQGTTQAQLGAVQSLLDSKYSNEYDVTGGGADGSFTLTMKPTAETALEEKTVQQAIETIRDRVDALGVSEPVIQEYGLGKDQILLELPGVTDMNEVRKILHETARLEIHAVVGTTPFKDEQEALASVNGVLPPDEMMLHGASTVTGGGDDVYILRRQYVVGGSDFRSADPGTDNNTGQRVVRFTLTNEAGDKFYDYTSKNINTSMAVVMDGHVKEVANIEGAIRDQGLIRGSFSPDEVMALSKLLRTGALPASLQEIETRTVGASLGADSIRDGVRAAIAGVLVVMAFMLIYYRGSGINADLALFLNLVILLGFMGFSGATLTLPGIAGVILTIGMGVDSNVLIFERIREEVRAGKAPAAAVDQGFAHAWVTIVDTHVTTIVSAAILIVFGTGPVKGFAVTLTFGLLANLFTAVFVSRVIFDWHLGRLKPGEAVSI